MTKSDDSAYPYMDTCPMTDQLTIAECGLTKREYFALHLMQGMLANRKLVEWGDYNAYSLAIEAVHAADALIQELNKQ